MSGAPLRPGERRGDFVGSTYLLGDFLGSGGASEVYRATNIALGRDVALKLFARTSKSAKQVEAARAAATVRHAGLAEVVDVGLDEDGAPFVVQPLLRGEDLGRYLGSKPREQRRLTESEALEILIPVSQAVAAAHARSVVHGSLHPANVILAREIDRLVPKVLDLGARVLGAQLRGDAIRYAAPETLATSRVDATSDVWSLGILLYELLVGATPFDAPNDTAARELVRAAKVPPLRQSNPAASTTLEEIVARCTARDPTKRYPNAGEVAAALTRARQGRASEARQRVDTAPELDPPSAAPRAVAGPPRDAVTDELDALVSLSGPDDLSVWASAPPPAPSSPPIPSARPSPPSARSSTPSAPPSRPSSPQPASAARAEERISSLPPVLALFGVSGAVSSAPPPPAPAETTGAAAPSASELAHVARVAISSAPPSAPKAERPAKAPTPRAEVARRWTALRTAGFAGAFLLPAVTLFGIARGLGLLTPLGDAMRGASTATAGVLTVLVMLATLVLGWRALQSRAATTITATCAAGLFAIVMLVVTLAAGEAAETGMPPAAAGIVPLVAPIAPLALAVASLGAARSMWLSPYERKDALLAVGAASFALLVALVLSPVGAVHVAARATRSHAHAPADGH